MNLLMLVVIVMVVLLFIFLIKKMISKNNKITLFGDIHGRASDFFGNINIFRFTRNKSKIETKNNEDSYFEVGNKDDPKKVVFISNNSSNNIENKSKIKKIIREHKVDDESKKEEVLDNQKTKNKKQNHNKSVYSKISNVRSISFQESFDKIKDSNIIYVIDYLKNRNYIIKKDILEKVFKSDQELLEFLKRDILNFLKEKVDSLKKNISSLRKHGREVNSESLKLMEIPLKLKIFEVSFKKDDFSKVVKLIEDLENSLKKYEENKDFS